MVRGAQELGTKAVRVYVALQPPSVSPGDTRVVPETLGLACLPITGTDDRIQGGGRCRLWRNELVLYFLERLPPYCE